MSFEFKNKLLYGTMSEQSPVVKQDNVLTESNGMQEVHGFVEALYDRSR